MRKRWGGGTEVSRAQQWVGHPAIGLRDFVVVIYDVVYRLT